MRRLLRITALIALPLTACTPSVCEVDGVQRRVGESWTCADGCNTCTCTLDGVSTTDMACNIDTGGPEDTGTSAE